MKASLLNKNIVYEFINENKKIIKNTNNEKNILFFNFLLILFFIVCFLFLLFRYLEKKKDKKNIS
jgi:ABC-type amino acid transport system permease subunit